jgi:hypothetical protein
VSLCLLFQVSLRLDDGKEVGVEWDRGRVFDKQVAEYFLVALKDGRTGL